MKSMFLFMLLLAPISLSAEDLSLDGARRLAERYYAVLERAASQPKEARIVFDNELVSIFGTDFNGKSVEDQFWVANDADAVFGANGGKLSSISVQDYITKIRSYAKAGRIRLEHELLDCFYLKGPSLDKKEQAPYIEVLVRRTLYRDGIRMEEFVERMDIKVSTAFPFIGNKYGSMPESAEGAIATAYSLYRQKEYDEAFRMFQHALKMQPSNEDASYRLGVMCYQGKGCKQYPKRVRHLMAEFYWLKTEKGRKRLGISYAERISSPKFGIIGIEAYDPVPSNRILFVDDDRYGFMDSHGNVKIPAKYFEGAFPFFSNGTTVVQQNCGRSLCIYLIDTNGYVLEKLPAYNGSGYTYDERRPRYDLRFSIAGLSNWIWHSFGRDLFINRYTGERLYIDNRRLLNEHNTTLARDVNGKMGVLNDNIQKIMAITKENILIPFEYDSIEEIYYDNKICMFLVRQDALYGAVSARGEEITSCRHRNIMPLWINDDEKMVTILLDYDVDLFNNLLEKYGRKAAIPGDQLHNVGKTGKFKYY